MEGLQSCHNKGILHRDIKLDNILLNSNGDIKVYLINIKRFVILVSVKWLKKEKYLPSNVELPLI